ncbi:hypothetical protein ABZ639_11280 [Saccharomonospora sp. NPDC006951]
MILRRLAGILSVFAAIALIVLTLVAVLGDAGPQEQHRFAIASAVCAALLSLTRLPLIRPPRRRGRERSRFAATLGGCLIVLLWLARASVYGYAVFVFTVGLSDTTFDATAAVLAVTGRLLTLAGMAARHLAGFAVDWDFLRGLNMPRYVLGLAATAPLVGFGGLLAEFAENVVLWVPVHTYELLHGWGLWSWLSVVLACVAYLPVVVAAVVVESVLQYAAGLLLGKDNVAGAWLTEHLPARLVLTDTEYRFEYKFLFEFGKYGPRRPRTVGRRGGQRLARYEQPLTDDEQRLLIEDLADGLSADFPPRWANFSLTYRAAGDHEEVTARLNVMSPPDDKGISVGRPREWDLTGFAGIDALRRLRAAAYSAGLGTPFEWVLSFDAERGFLADENVVRPRGRARWRPEYSGTEPEWRNAPSRTDYRKDLRRFPIVRTMRPVWLRERLTAPAPRRQPRARPVTVNPCGRGGRRCTLINCRSGRQAGWR